MTVTTNRGGSLQVFWVKYTGSEHEIHYNCIATYCDDVITAHAHINEPVAAAVQSLKMVKSLASFFCL